MKKHDYLKRDSAESTYKRPVLKLKRLQNQNEEEHVEESREQDETDYKQVCRSSHCFM